MKIVVQMSEWSQMIELNIISKSEAPNLTTLHCMACTDSYRSIYSELLPKMLLTTAIY